MPLKKETNALSLDIDSVQNYFEGLSINTQFKLNDVTISKFELTSVTWHDISVQTNDYHQIAVVSWTHIILYKLLVSYRNIWNYTLFFFKSYKNL